MVCNHKFYGNEELIGLLPNWKCKTLIIGTFNPENKFHSTNTANFFYQRSRNYFWDVLPLLSNIQSIEKTNKSNQIEYLKKFEIGITDLLISIQDADENNNDHIKSISTVKDEDIERFNDFNWNTNPILQFLKEQKIKAVFFTKLGNPNAIHVYENTFENQMRKIEDFCETNDIYCRRLHSPTGMGLGPGKRIETLRERWIQNGANQEYFK